MNNSKVPSCVLYFNNTAFEKAWPRIAVRHILPLPEAKKENKTYFHKILLKVKIFSDLEILNFFKFSTIYIQKKKTCQKWKSKQQSEFPIFEREVNHLKPFKGR